MVQHVTPRNISKSKREAVRGFRLFRLSTRGRIILPLMVAVFSLSAVSGAPPKQKALTAEQIRLNRESFDFAWTTIRDKHFDPAFGGLDWDAVRRELEPRMAQARTMDEARWVLEEMISRLKLSHLAIIPGDIYTELSSPEPVGEDSGSPGLEVRVVEQRVLVTRLAPESAAGRTGVRTGWELVRVDGCDIRKRWRALQKELPAGMDKASFMSAIVQSRLNGKIGTSVEVRFREERGRLISLRLLRLKPSGEEFRLGYFPPLHVRFEARRIENGIGYISFNAFMDPGRLMPAFNQAMESFRDCRGLVIDLRGNMGGMGDIAVGMAGWLIEKNNCSLGELITRNNRLQFTIRPRPETYSGRLAILADGLSASCAEFLSSGLQELGRAKIFGSRTAGVVLFSLLERLPNGDILQYPFGDFHSIRGKRLEGTGVVPDVPVVHTRQSLLAGRDLPLEASLAWINQ